MRIYNTVQFFAIILFMFIITHCSKIDDDIECDECQYNIHRRCNNNQSYTEEEVENVRIYLQKRFAVTNPIRKPCAKLHVRRDIKCLSPKELHDLINVFQQLYENGVVDKFTYIHDKYYVAAHKFGEAIPWHRWFLNEFEKEMMKVNQNVTLPYWGYPIEFNAPEKSLIWKIFGHSGNEHDGCVKDGPFAKYTLNITKPHCLRRRWHKDGTMEVWESPEWVTAALQIGLVPSILNVALNTVIENAVKTEKHLLNLVKLAISEMSYNTYPNQLWTVYALLMGRTTHFKTHNSIGGLMGDMSMTTAPNDLVFYCFHDYLILNILKWQLQDDRHLIPKMYDFTSRYDTETKKIYPAEIEHDFLNYYSNITVKETFQVGYGELCYTHDQMIKPINDLLKNKKPKLPIAAQRLKEALPRDIFEYYFPKFADCNSGWTYFDYELPDVGNCNPPDSNGFCEKIRVAKRFNETEAGRKTLEVFKNLANIDITANTFAAEDVYYKFMHELELSNYCSPYV